MTTADPALAMPHLVSVADVRAQRVLAIREQRAVADMPALLNEALRALYYRSTATAAAPAGPPFVIYHSFGEGGVDAEVCLPVETDVPATPRIACRALPPMTVARTIHSGPYERLHAAYAALATWVARHDLAPAGPMSERYLVGPADSPSPSEYVTEVSVPVVASSSRRSAASGHRAPAPRGRHQAMEKAS